MFVVYEPAAETALIFALYVAVKTQSDAVVTFVTGVIAPAINVYALAVA